MGQRKGKKTERREEERRGDEISEAHSLAFLAYLLPRKKLLELGAGITT